jgi:CRP-like cAMP-binding protein
MRSLAQRDGEAPAGARSGVEPVDIEQLRAIGLFGGLDDEALCAMRSRLSPVEVSAGVVLFHEGDRGSELFIVQQGDLEVLKRTRTGELRRIARLRREDWFGEMAILDVMPRSTTVRTLTPVRLLRLPASALRGLYHEDLKAYAMLLMNVAREMSRRLRAADQLLAEIGDEVCATGATDP